MDSQAKELVEAIGAQWRIFAIACVTFLFYAYRNYIGEFFKNLGSFKWSRSKDSSSIEMNREQIISGNLENDQIKNLEDQNSSSPISLAPESIPQSGAGSSKLPGLISAIIELYSDVENADKLFSKHLETVTDETQRLKDKVAYVFQKFAITRKTSLIGELQKLSENKMIQNLALLRVYSAYESLREYSEAQKIANLGYEKAGTKLEKAEWFINIQTVKFDIGERDKLEGVYLKEIRSTDDADVKTLLIKGLSEFYEKSGDEYKKMLSLALFVSEAKDPTEKLFGLAYTSSESGDLFRSIAMMYYLRLLQYEPKNAVALNNLGALFSDVGMKVKSVSYYEKASKQKETLSMANLGNKYLDSGFANLAQEQIKLARENEQPHKNISKLETRIHDLEKSENDTYEAMQKAAVLENKFLLRYAELSLFEEPHSFSGCWKDGNGIVYELSGVIDAITFGSDKVNYRYLILRKQGKGMEFAWQKEKLLGDWPLGWDTIGNGFAYFDNGKWHIYRKKSNVFGLGDLCDLIKDDNATVSNFQ